MRKTRKKLPGIKKFPKQMLKARKVDFSFLDLHKKFVEKGQMSHGGLCLTAAADAFFQTKNEGRIKVIDLFSPTHQNRADFELFPSGEWDGGYWGRGMADNHYFKIAYEMRQKAVRRNGYFDLDEVYTPLRQTVLLLMAAWNNEL